MARVARMLIADGAHRVTQPGNGRQFILAGEGAWGLSAGERVPDTLRPPQRTIFSLAYRETTYDLGCAGLGFLGGDTGAALFQLGQPVAGSKPFLTKGAAAGTSPLSSALRGIVRSPVAIPTPTGGPGAGSPLRMMATKDLGAAAARYAPFLSAAATAYSAYKMNQCLSGHP